MRAKIQKKSHMRKGYAIFLFGCVLFEEVVSYYFLERERMTVKVSKVAMNSFSNSAI